MTADAAASPTRPGPSASAISAGLLASFVGFSSTFAVILHGLEAVGASRAEAASGLMAVTIAMGLGSVILSLSTRMPVMVAWSTPGAALLATSAAPAGGFRVAIGAFVVSALLIMAAGLWRAFGRLVANIPAPIANAMLAGVLFNLCLAPVKAIAEAPISGLAVALVWAVVGQFRRLLAVPAAVITTAAFVIADTSSGRIEALMLWPQPLLHAPDFTLAAAIGLGIPLFIVTMASQNIPGVAILKIHDYTPEPTFLFRVTGALSLLATPFGGHAVNLAAITAAICAGKDADPDPDRRWWAGFTSGCCSIALGLAAGTIAGFFGDAPPLVVEAVAGLALLGAFAASAQAALSEAATREAAVITFITAASGIAFLGVSSAFWGLVAGGALLALTRRRRTAA